ncbi:APC family permease [Cryobacterium sp. TMT1-21]|uniref:APC family permease n=1 Tax=Cryobacterium shii TaxID=1259235 RepID=A0AAQ2C612_9MICO|nr:MULTISPECIES: APC family permease [Cryobacterium]TFC46594.1 APC family permease [Cryobacterium shii]TFC84587.1 APC family permease [Cryobacterium sp. TmT2-59]TFD14116.1 APC family permease [Cryobacterium sp. TMT4-10]TFD17612.1 APC family permease [Cryobacterium sp. TMT1-21]TFD22711.1 APC family permease [Cryobacterium sp. TMT2-23]
MTPEVSPPAPETRSPKRWIIGDPLSTEKLEGQLLPKHLALPIFASDPLSSVAYAPQELLMILTLGGLAFLSFAPWVAAVVVLLLVVVTASYRQLIKAYPSGGGDYEVAHKNLGEKAGLVVASALLVDYVMTVVVSVASGVDNIISALPGLAPFRVEFAVFFVILLAAVNLRGVHESSKAFAIPTYLFIASVLLMVVVGLTRVALGDTPMAESAGYEVEAQNLAQSAFILLLLRSFASGCSALTGVEAIANGVPAFKHPKVKNAQRTLVLMGGIAITLFVGLTTLALFSKVHYAENPCDLIGWQECATSPQRSLIAQIAAATFGNNSIMFFVLQAATAAVLLLAANTAFNGFPLLGSVLAKDSYAPKSLSTRGDRLIYSNGVLLLAFFACVILVIYQANLTVLIQLYIIGVFVSFTLGQTGMVRHWLSLLKTNPPNRASIVASLSINGFGALLTGVVLIVVTITKFTHGAWLVFVLMPVLFTLMLGVNRYYRDVAKEIEVDSETTFGSQGDHAIVLVGKMQKPVLKALDYAIAARHESIEAVHISIDNEETKELKRAWVKQNIQVPLHIVQSPYRDISWPLISYIKDRREDHGSEVVTVYTPIYIVGHWWESLLHNHKARRLRQKLMLVHGVTIALVPWLLDSSELIYGRRSRPVPGQDRRGEPVRPRPIPRRPLAPATKEIPVRQSAVVGVTPPKSRPSAARRRKRK